MKFLLELLLSIVLHPVAYVLALINIAGRNELNTAQKVIWAVVCIVWGIGPILYVMVGGGELW
ncbi:MAG: PLDc N-terminal domain-containing protein [Candidatus Dormibacteraeota bacterium]|nr:PLDc N-terminal domain-containing protein [Candidatus Dormibacteraeota bacterium]